jgi:hypothetical protein
VFSRVNFPPIVERETGGTMESVEQYEVLFYDVPTKEA